MMKIRINRKFRMAAPVVAMLMAWMDGTESRLNEICYAHLISLGFNSDTASAQNYGEKSEHSKQMPAALVSLAMVYGGISLDELARVSRATRSAEIK